MPQRTRSGNSRIEGGSPGTAQFVSTCGHRTHASYERALRRSIEASRTGDVARYRGALEDLQDALSNDYAGVPPLPVSKACLELMLARLGRVGRMLATGSLEDLHEHDEALAAGMTFEDEPVDFTDALNRALSSAINARREAVD